MPDSTPLANAAQPSLPPAPQLSAAQRQGAALGFDYGERRIGVALGNGITRHAQPLSVIQNLTVAHRFAAIEQLIQTWQPTHLVVGFPLLADGGAQKMTGLATRFGNQLHGRFNLPVTWVDERYSTMAAEMDVRRTEAALDAQAACIILQQYFDETSAA
jgi:putative holliday junction resolvase